VNERDQHNISQITPEAISSTLLRHVRMYSGAAIAIAIVTLASLTLWNGTSSNQVNQLSHIGSVKEMLPVISAQVRLGDYEHTEIKRQQLLADIDKVRTNTQTLMGGYPAIAEAFKASVSYWDSTSQTNRSLNDATQLMRDEFTSLKSTIAQEPPSAQRLQLALALDTQLTSNANNSNVLSQLNQDASLAVSQIIERISQAQSQLDSIESNIETSREGLVYQGITAIENLNNALSFADRDLRQQLAVKDRNIAMIGWGLVALIFVLAVFFYRQFSSALSSLLDPYRTVINSARHIRHVNLKLEDQIRRKRSFLSVVSYEARTLLSAITGSAHQAQQTAQNEQAKKHINSVVSSGAHLESILNDVLTMIDVESKQFNLDGRVFNFHRLLKSVKDRYTVACDSKGIKFKLAAEKSICKLYSGDAKQIRRILDNLLTTSVRFTDKGSIQLSIEVDSANSTPGEQRLNFTLEDSGLAVPEIEQANYFEPYERSFGSARGGEGYSIRTGLAAALIKEMGGSIQVTNDGSQGVTLSFYINVGMAAPGAEELPIDEQLDAVDLPTTNDVQKLNILVVDDNETNAQMLQWMLEDMSHDVSTASSGAACLKLVEEHYFDIIFMDQYMPEMDGAKATKTIRARSDAKASVPIIGCTADGFQETRDLLKEAGQNDIIVKPVAVADVLSVMKKLNQGHFSKTLN
jgi:signal transduction histidine kinase/ActR/RegA family two-component response regulator